MWRGYFYKIVDDWTTPLENLPRWFASNSYLALSQSVSIPSFSSFSATGSYTTPTTTLPSSWVLTSPASTTGNTFRRLFEVFVNEKESLNPILRSILKSRALYFDTSDPEYAWLVTFDKSVYKLEIELSNGNRISVTKASSIFDLFWSGEYRFVQDGSTVLIYGLDLIETDTEDRGSGWQYNKYSTFNKYLTWFLHPNTHNFFPIHPDNIRSDGLLGYNSSTTTKIRSRLSAAGKALSSVIVYLNDQKSTANRINLWNSVDEKALLTGLTRQPSETNSTLGTAVERCFWFGGQTKRKTRSYISSALRQGAIVTAPASSTIISFPASSTGYQVRNVSSYGIVAEYLMPNPDNTSFYKSSTGTRDFGAILLNNQFVSYTDHSTGLELDFNITHNKLDRPIASWYLTYWTATATGMTLSDNYPENVPDLIIFCAKHVDLPIPSSSTLRKVYKKDPSNYWQNEDLSTVPVGMSTFL